MIKKLIFYISAFFLIIILLFSSYYIYNSKLTASIKIKIIDNLINNRDSINIYGVSPLGKTIQFKQKAKLEWEHNYSRTYKKIILKLPEKGDSSTSSIIVVFIKNNIPDTLRLKNKTGSIDLLTLSESRFSIFETLLFPLRLYLNYLILFFIIIVLYFSVKVIHRYWNNIITFFRKFKDFLLMITKSSKRISIKIYKYLILIFIKKPIYFLTNLSKGLYSSYTFLIKYIKDFITSNSKTIANKTIHNIRFYNEKRKIIINFSSPKDILLLVCIIFGVIYIAKCILLIFSPSYDIGDCEPLFVGIISDLVNTGIIYTNGNQPPFFTQFDLPIYFYANYLILKLFNLNYIGINQLPIVYLAGRIISTLSLFLSIWVFFKIQVKLLRIDVKTSLISSLIIMMIIPTLYISVRTESLSLLFFTSALYFVFKYINYKSIKGLVLISLFSNLALFTRIDTAVIFPAFLILLIYNRNYRHIYIYILLCITFAFLIILTLIGFSNLYYSIKSLFTSEGFNLFIFSVSIPYFIKISPLILASFYISYKWIKKINEQKLILIIILYLFFIEATLFCFKLGGLFLYLIPFEIIGVLVIAIYSKDSYFSLLNNKIKILALGIFLPYFIFSIYYKDTLTKFGIFASVMIKNPEYNNAEEQNIKNLYNYMTYDLKLKKDEYLISDIWNVIMVFPKNYIMDIEFFYNSYSYAKGMPDFFNKNKFFIKNKYIESFRQEGKIKYIIIFNVEENKNFIKDNYPNYYEKKELSRYSVFEYNSKRLPLQIQ